MSIDHAKRLRSFAESLEAVLDDEERLQKVISDQSDDIARGTRQFWQIVKAFHGWEDGGDHLYDQQEQADLISAWIKEAKRSLGE